MSRSHADPTSRKDKGSSRYRYQAASSVKPTREEWTKFAADKFKWLRQIAFNPEYPLLASKFAIQLLPRFNLEYGGIGWASQDTLAEDLGCHRQTVNRLFGLFVKHSDLTYERGGWGRSNRYRMVVKNEITDVRADGHQEQAATPTDVRRHGQSDVRCHGHESILTNQGGQLRCPPWRERCGCRRTPLWGPGLTATPSGEEREGRLGCQWQ
jgi:hypothetical protein